MDMFEEESMDAMDVLPEIIQDDISDQPPEDALPEFVFGEHNVSVFFRAEGGPGEVPIVQSPDGPKRTYLMDSFDRRVTSLPYNCGNTPEAIIAVVRAETIKETDGERVVSHFANYPSLWCELKFEQNEQLEISHHPAIEPTWGFARNQDGSFGLVPRVVKLCYPTDAPVVEMYPILKRTNYEEGTQKFVIMPFSFDTIAREELKVARGEVVEIMCHPAIIGGWVMGRTRSGAVGLLPRYINVELQSPSEMYADEPWWHGSISRGRAEQLLQSGSVGNFLVREYEPEKLAISVRGETIIKHFKIDDHSMKGEVEFRQFYFQRLADFLTYFQQNAISTRTERITLGAPFPK